MEELLKQLIESEEVKKALVELGDIKYFEGVIEAKYKDLFDDPHFQPKKSFIAQMAPSKGHVSNVYSLLYQFEQVVRAGEKAKSL